MYLISLKLRSKSQISCSWERTWPAWCSRLLSSPVVVVPNLCVFVCVWVSACACVSVVSEQDYFLWSVYPHVSSTLRSTLCVRVCVLSILLSSNVPFIKVWSQSFAVSGRVLHGQRRRFCRIFCVGRDHHWRCGRLVSRAGGWRGFGSLRLVYLENN